MRSSKKAATPKLESKPVGVFSLLPGLKWSGKLRVTGYMSNGDIAVAFDAVDTAAAERGEASFVYDCAALTPKQFREWTGWRS